jgi:hypothetical protein
VIAVRSTSASVRGVANPFAAFWCARELSKVRIAARRNCRACCRCCAGTRRGHIRYSERYMDAAELAAVLGKKPSGGHWNSGVAVLRNNGLIETDGRRYRSAALFRK